MPTLSSPSPWGLSSIGDEKDEDYTFHFHFEGGFGVVELNVS